MPDDMGDRTEEATPRRVQEAREKGQVARSADLSTALILLGGLLVIKFTGGGITDALYRIMTLSLENLGARSVTIGDICSYFAGGGLFLLKAMLPVVAGLAAVAFAANVVQTGVLVSAEPLKFQISRLNPIEGVKRLLSKRGLVRLMASLFKVVVVALVAYFTIRSMVLASVDLTGADFQDIVAFTMSGTFNLALRIAIALLALAILDYAFQRWQHLEDLRMTKQEVRDELKRMEGDPLTRDRRRRIARQLAMQRMMHDVPKADVVITNPTHLAVALRYDAVVMSAPTVVAKGRDLIARRIREIAEEHDVPIVERRPLAQALYKMCEVGDQVPASFYQAVAEVLAFVYELNRMKSTSRAGA